MVEPICIEFEETFWVNGKEFHYRQITALYQEEDLIIDTRQIFSPKPNQEELNELEKKAHTYAQLKNEELRMKVEHDLHKIKVAEWQKSG